MSGSLLLALPAINLMEGKREIVGSPLIFSTRYSPLESRWSSGNTTAHGC